MFKNIFTINLLYYYIDILFNIKIKIFDYVRYLFINNNFMLNDVELYTNISKKCNAKYYFENYEITKIDAKLIYDIYKFYKINFIDNEDIRLKIDFTYNNNNYILYYPLHKQIFKDFSKDEYYIPYKNEPSDVKIKKIEDINNYINFLINDLNTIASERFVKLVKYSLVNDIIRDQGAMSLLMSIIMTSSIHIIGIDRNQKFFGTSPLKNDIALIFCSYIGLLNRMQKYEGLNEFLSDYINSDKNHKEIFKTWLYDNLGHTDEDIFYDIIAKANGLNI
jgi:hypothetical protein